MSPSQRSELPLGRPFLILHTLLQPHLHSSTIPSGSGWHRITPNPPKSPGRRQPALPRRNSPVCLPARLRPAQLVPPSARQQLPHSNKNKGTELPGSDTATRLVCTPGAKQPAGSDRTCQKRWQGDREGARNNRNNNGPPPALTGEAPAGKRGMLGAAPSIPKIPPGMLLPCSWRQPSGKPPG